MTLLKFCLQTLSYHCDILVFRNQEGVNKPPLSTLLLLVIHHVRLHMWKGPPKLQTAQHNPPYGVFSASQSL